MFDNFIQITLILVRGLKLVWKLSESQFRQMYSNNADPREGIKTHLSRERGDLKIIYSNNADPREGIKTFQPPPPPIQA